MAMFKVFNKKKAKKTKNRPAKKAVKKAPKRKIVHKKTSKPKIKPKKTVKKVKPVKKAAVKKAAKIQQPKPLVNKMQDEKAFELLKRYRIKVPDYEFCKDEGELSQALKKIGFPIVMKASGQSIIHKTDVNAIRLNIESEQDASNAFADLMKVEGCEKVLVQKMIKEGYEIIVGARKDPQFKMVVALGAGGVFTEFLRDVSFIVPPITEEAAQNMVSEVRFSELLFNGFRGQKPANRQAIVNTILTVSRIMEANPKIKELDINPLFATSEEAYAADIRIILE